MAIKECGKAAIAVAAVMVVAATVPVTASASEAAAPTVTAVASSSGTAFQLISGNKLRVSSDSHEFVEQDGVMVAVDRVTGLAEDLPATAVDATGSRVTLYYESAGAGGVVVTAVLLAPTSSASNIRAKRGERVDDWRCWLGIVGTGIGGALAGVAAGSAVPGVGTIAGGIAGAISGNAVGTATYC